MTGTMEERMEELARELRREIKANRGSGDLVNTHDLCLVPRVDVPKKFKVPEFDRYNGLTCPQNHIIKYVRKMANYSDNDSLMIHCFQDSLMEDAAEWYTGLSKDDIRTFDDLAAAFKSHYGFNTRLKPNREFLRSLSQKKDESFREYAQRWRGAAARITPALDEEEMTQTFLKTLKKDYVERMIIAAPSNFSEMVTMGTRLEEAVREGIIVFEKDESSNAPKKYGNGHHKKKESEVGMVSTEINQSVAAVAPIMLLNYLYRTNTCNTPNIHSFRHFTISILYRRASLRSPSTLSLSKCNNNRWLNNNRNNSKVPRLDHLFLRYQCYMLNCFLLCCTKGTAQPDPASLRPTHYLLGSVRTSGAIFIKALWATMWKDVTL